jgi:IclR family acetate operon transcriptional repressor
LVDVDYVGQNAASGRYHLGPKLLALAARDELHLDQLRRTMRPHLEKLRAETDETVNLVVPAGTSVVYVDQAQSTQSVRMFTAIGRMVPMHATAAGKAMMAFWAAEDERFWEARPLEAVTDTTIVEPAKIRSELASIKRRGYAVENGEFEDGVSCVAAPVFGADGAVRAAISVAAPSVRLKRFEISALGKMVRAHADRGSHDMGAPQPLGRGQQGS